jgi:hypothetical protein
MNAQLGGKRQVSASGRQGRPWQRDTFHRLSPDAGPTGHARARSSRRRPPGRRAAAPGLLVLQLPHLVLPAPHRRGHPSRSGPRTACTSAETARGLPRRSPGSNRGTSRCRSRRPGRSHGHLAAAEATLQAALAVRGYRRVVTGGRRGTHRWLQTLWLHPVRCCSSGRTAAAGRRGAGDDAAGGILPDSGYNEVLTGVRRTALTPARCRSPWAAAPTACGTRSGRGRTRRPPGELIPAMEVVLTAEPGPFGEVVRMTVSGTRIGARLTNVRGLVRPRGPPWGRCPRGPSS